MPPQAGQSESTGVLYENEDDANCEVGAELEEREFTIDVPRTIKNILNLDVSKIVWQNLIAFVVLHIVAINGLYLTLTGHVMWQTLIVSFVCYILSGLGITMAAHRLFAHKSYKASAPLKIFLLFCNTMAFQNHCYEWARDHRSHHKYSETDADPHNAKRGFFFSHMGWLMYRKHPEVIKQGKKIDMSDLENDPYVMFQRKYFFPYLSLPIAFIIPSILPSILFGETLWNGYALCFFRYCMVLHFTWFVNSLAHFSGHRPYDKSIYPSQNFTVALFALGEGWHNYHHVFPWDYRTNEFGCFVNINFTSVAIKFASMLGLAWDLKTVSKSVIDSRVKRTGKEAVRVKQT